MGGALIEGLLLSGKYGKEDIVVATPDLPGQERFSSMGVQVFANNTEAVAEADLVILAVKPYLVDEVAMEIRSHMPKDALVASVAAGRSLESLQDAFGEERACFRVMPNIAAAYRASMTFVACEERFDAIAPIVLDIFGLVGDAVLIPERLMDTAMVNASCGLAYAMRYIRAAMEASIEMGMSADLSKNVVCQTVRGAAELLLNSELHPEEAIDRVSTPGGMTIVGLNAMEHNGFTSAVLEGHGAAYRKVKGIG